jgi:superfamily II DNA/RNA helicase
MRGVENDVEMTFDELGLHPAILRGVYAYGFSVPTAVQKTMIRAVAAGSSCIVRAPSCNGKTCAMLVAFLNELATWINQKEEARTLQLCWRFGQSGLRVLLRDVVGLISKILFDRRRRPRML